MWIERARRKVSLVMPCPPNWMFAWKTALRQPRRHRRRRIRQLPQSKLRLPPARRGPIVPPAPEKAPVDPRMFDHLKPVALAAAVAILAAAPQAFAATFTLEPTPSTVAWGHYDGNDKPALPIKSGDTVAVHTLLTNNPTGLKANGVPDDP